MSRWHFFDAATGQYRGSNYQGPEEFMAANTPAGTRAVQIGERDPSRTRVDITTGDLLDHEPPVDREALASVVRAEMALIEKQQARPLRELSINPSDAAARERLRELDARMRVLREQL